MGNRKGDVKLIQQALAYYKLKLHYTSITYS